MDRFVEDSDGVAAANQRRMNADPFETLLINMGYDIQGIQYSMSRGISFATVQNAWFQKTQCSRILALWQLTLSC